MSTLGERVQAVEFDHPFTIVSGDVQDVAGVYSPEVYNLTVGDVEIGSDEWEAVSQNMTGQYGYNGPVMHASEYIGEVMAERLAELAEDYRAFVITTVEVLPDESSDEYTAEELADYESGTWAPEPAGWIVLGLRK